MNIQFATSAGSYESQRLSGFQPAGVVFRGGVMQEEKRWKRGDVREDGKIFWRKCGNKEYWFDKCEFNQRRVSVAKWNASKYSQNRQLFLLRFKKYQKENKDKIATRKAINRRKNINKIRIYYASNKRAINSATNERNKLKRRINPIFTLKERCRRRINHGLYCGLAHKKESSFDLIGCDWENLRKHIENKFCDGMSWDNRSDWQIDHIIPLSSAFDEYSMKMLFYYTNLRPLWRKDNLLKSNNWNPPEYCI